MSRETDIHCARVYIHQARHFRQRDVNPWFVHVLLGWAANARRRAAAHPKQRVLL